MAIDCFSHFAVPLFILISGFVLYNKYSGKIEIKKFYERRLMSVLPQYLIFSTFYIGTTYIGSIILAKSLNLDIPKIVYFYVTGGSEYHLWFFILIIQLYILYPALIGIYNFCHSRGKSAELLLLVFLMGVIYNVYPMPDVFILGKSTRILETLTKFIPYLFYFILGIIIRNRYEELLRKSISKKSIYCISVLIFCYTFCGIFFYAENYFNIDISKILPIIGDYSKWVSATISPLYYVSIFALFFYISLHIVNQKGMFFDLLKKIGNYSFGIYLIHVFIMTVLLQVFPRFGLDWNNWLFYPLIFCLTLTFSIISVDVIKRLPYSKYIIGSTR